MLAQGPKKRERECQKPNPKQNNQATTKNPKRKPGKLKVKVSETLHFHCKAIGSLELRSECAGPYRAHRSGGAPVQLRGSRQLIRRSESVPEPQNRT